MSASTLTACAEATPTASVEAPRIRMSRVTSLSLLESHHALDAGLLVRELLPGQGHDPRPRRQPGRHAAQRQRRERREVLAEGDLTEIGLELHVVALPEVAVDDPHL